MFIYISIELFPYSSIISIYLFIHSFILRKGEGQIKKERGRERLRERRKEGGIGRRKERDIRMKQGGETEKVGEILKKIEKGKKEKTGRGGVANGRRNRGRKRKMVEKEVGRKREGRMRRWGHGEERWRKGEKKTHTWIDR